VAVLGTGTGVGKTHASVALIAALSGRGDLVCGLKPIESGVVDGILTDAARLAEVSSVRAGPAPFTFGEPVSPHLAARVAGVTISVEAAAAWVRGHRIGVLVVETAGAVLSPLGPGVTNLDLTRALRPDAVVLVGLDRLGVLHEVSACLFVLRTLAPDLPEATVILNEPAEPDASTGTNAGELELLGIAGGVVVLPRAEPTSATALERAAGVAGRLVSWQGSVENRG
jgi:dethiobiotin synthetase